MKTISCVITTVLGKVFPTQCDVISSAHCAKKSTLYTKWAEELQFNVLALILPAHSVRNNTDCFSVQATNKN